VLLNGNTVSAERNSCTISAHAVFS